MKDYAACSRSCSRWNLFLAVWLLAIGTLSAGGQVGGLDEWTWRNPLPQANPLRGGASNGSVAVLVGDRGAIVTSADGISWSPRTSGSDRNLSGVAWGAGRFVAVGGTLPNTSGSAVVLTSPDAAVWTSVAMDAPGLHGIARSDTMFVAVGAIGTLLSSPDGVTWAKRSFPPTAPYDSFRGVAWGDGQFVAVGDSGKLATSPDGVNWTNRAAGTSEHFSAIAWSGSQFVVVGSRGGIFTSSNAMDWTSRKSGVSRPLSGVVWSGSQFVAFGGESIPAIGIALTSADGITWVSREPARKGALFGAVRHGTQVVVAGVEGTIQTSSDGVVWTERALGSRSPLRAIAANSTRFVAVGDAGAILTSDDGTSWTSRNSDTTSNLLGATWSGSGFFAVGTGGTILKSADGINWSKINAGSESAGDVLLGITASAGRFIAVGVYPGLAKGVILTSADGTTWSRRLVEAGGLQAVTWDGQRFVTVGRGGAILVSTDGQTWANHPLVAEMYGIAAGPDGYVVVGTGLITSPDGANWTSRYSGDFIMHSLRSVVWTGQQFVAVGDSGLITSSADGVDWISRPSGTDVALLGVASSNGRLVAVGASGAILAAEPTTTLPVIATQPQSQVVNAGANVGLAVATDLPATTRYQWLKDGETLSGATNPTLTLSAAEASAAGVYRVRVINGAGHVLSAPAELHVKLVAPGGGWQLAVPQESDLKRVAWSGSRFVAVGERGSVLTSVSGVSWSRLDLGVTEDLLGVTWGGGQFVAVGARSTVLTSPDGLNWTSRPTGTVYSLRGVGWNGTQFVAAGGSSGGRGAILTSPDGIAWTDRVQTSDDVFYGIATDGAIFVAVGAGGRILTSVDGVNWTSRVAAETEYLYQVVWTGSQFVAGGSSGTWLTSFNGIDWTQRSTGVSASVHGIAWSGSQFVAAAGYLPLMTSPDGENWTTRTVGASSYIEDVIWNGALFVAIGARTTILTSSDGVTWTSRSAGTPQPVQGTAYGNNLFVGVGGDGLIATSSDGIRWVERVSNTSSWLNDVTWSGHQFVAVGDGGAVITSPDGVTWTARSSGTTSALYGVAWNGHMFVAVGGYVGMGLGGTLLTSPDGAAWTPLASGTPTPLDAVVWNGSFFLVVGDSLVLTSPDGLAWTTRPTTTTSYLRGVAWNGQLFVAVGGGGGAMNDPTFGEILTSADGATWTRRTSGTSNWFYGVTWSGREFIAVGASGTIMTSVDGVDWTNMPEKTTVGLCAVTWGAGRGVAVGDNGTILHTTALPQTLSLIAAPESRTAGIGGDATFSVVAEGAAPISYQWRFNGDPISGATAATLTLTVQFAHAGSYDVVVTDAHGSVISPAATLGVSSSAKVTGSGTEVGSNTPHPNGKVFDQVLVSGAAEAITADWQQNQVTRTSFIDLDHDIVQVEFSGPGTLTLVLDAASAPARPVNYNQTVDYMKGHAGIIITGADERTNVSVFTVGRATAFDPTGGFNFLLPISATNDPANNGSPLFHGHDATNYDGIADIAYLAISSPTGKFGGVRTANAHYFASKGLTGIYAPGVAFSGPIYMGELTAFDSAVPVIVTGSAGDARITGGDLLQDNGQAVEVSGIAQLKFVDGSTSHGELLPAQANQAALEEDGVDVTEQIVVNPAP